MRTERPAHAIRRGTPDDRRIGATGHATRGVNARHREKPRHAEAIWCRNKRGLADSWHSRQDVRSAKLRPTADSTQHRPTKNAPRGCAGRSPFRDGTGDQYIPSIPPPGIAGAFSGSGFSTTTVSVVSRRPAIDAAFCSAVRVTLVGSITPAATRSSYLSLRAL